MEAAWSHIQVVYELLLFFIDHVDFSAQRALEFVDARFVREIVALFDSEDPRERDYLKTTLHRIYGKFMSLRNAVRLEAMHVFQQSAYEQHTHNGLAELLEILGSIINGFATPLKAEHIRT